MLHHRKSHLIFIFLYIATALSLSLFQCYCCTGILSIDQILHFIYILIEFSKPKLSIKKERYELLVLLRTALLFFTYQYPSIHEVGAGVPPLLLEVLKIAAELFYCIGKDCRW